MAIIVNSVEIVTDVVTEPVTLADAKAWMRISYNTDDTLIQDLIEGARKHIEKLTSLSFATKTLKANIELTGSIPSVWMVDVPYGPLVSITELKWKTGFNLYETLVNNDDYEKIVGKIWLYNAGNYIITYQAGYTTLPEDIKSDILTLVAWSYENRGKQMNADTKSIPTQYPYWDGLNYHQYKKVVI